MRLLLVNYEFPPLGGGAAGASMNIARELTGLGHEVAVLTSHFRGLPKAESGDGYLVRRVSSLRGSLHRSGPGQMLAFAASGMAAGLRLAAGWKPDASLCFFGIPGGLIGRVLKGVYGIPYVVSLRGGDVPGHQAGQLAAYHRVAAPIIRRIWRQASAVAANGSGLRDLARTFEPGLPVPLIPNGVDTRAFFPAGGAERGPGPARLLFVGRISAEKGLENLLALLAGIGEGSWSLDVVGDGPGLPGLKALAESLGIKDRIRFQGWLPRERLPEIYRASDVFVFPSEGEGLPNAVLEAMASGLPVLGLDVPGVNDLVADGETGYLVQPGDGPELARRLDRLILDPRLADRLGSNGRERASLHFSWRKCAESYAELCGRAAEDRGRIGVGRCPERGRTS